MHALPSVIVLPFPRAPHQGPSWQMLKEPWDKSYMWSQERRREARGMPPGRS